MQNLDSFVANKRFYGEEHFPYGISRSGEFNNDQAELLEVHGIAYQELHSGLRVPVNDEEREFVSVCKGHKAPQTKHEITWMRYCQKVQERTITPASVKKFVDQGLENAPSLDEEW